MNDHAEYHRHPDQLLAMRVRLIVEEYRAVQQLLMFRLEAMEQRLPLTAAGIGALLVAAGALPKLSQVVLLVGLPFAILFCVRSIILHAAFPGTMLCSSRNRFSHGARGSCSSKRARRVGVDVEGAVVAAVAVGVC